MTDKKLEEAATARSLKFWQWPQDSSENIIYQQGFLDGAKWAYENPKLCEWCEQPELKEFWHDHNGQRICKECYDHHKG